MTLSQRTASNIPQVVRLVSLAEEDEATTLAAGHQRRPAELHPAGHVRTRPEAPGATTT
jgi:hypothetical protein